MKDKIILVLATAVSMLLGMPIDSTAADNDENLLKYAQQQLKEYLESRPTASEWVIEVDTVNNVVKTNWYKEHKGEVIQKDEIAVHQGLIRVDVWQKSGLIFLSEGKNDWTRRQEWAIQERLDQARTPK